jgi:hypothetical protein
LPRRLAVPVHVANLLHFLYRLLAVPIRIRLVVPIRFAVLVLALLSTSTLIPGSIAT